MPDLGDIPILSRGAIPGAAGAGAPGPGAPGAASSGLVWLEDGQERPFLDADAPRPWLEAEEGEGRPVEHLHPRKDDDPPTLLWV